MVESGDVPYVSTIHLVLSVIEEDQLAEGLQS